MCPSKYTIFAVSGKVGGPVYRINHTSWMAVVTLIDRLKSVRARCVINFWWHFCVATLLLDFSVGVGVFVIGLSQIPSFFSFE